MSEWSRGQVTKGCCVVFNVCEEMGVGEIYFIDFFINFLKHRYLTCSCSSVFRNWMSLLERRKMLPSSRSGSKEVSCVDLINGTVMRTSCRVFKLFADPRTKPIIIGYFSSYINNSLDVCMGQVTWLSICLEIQYFCKNRILMQFIINIIIVET